MFLLQGVHEGNGEPKAGAGSAREGPHLPRGRARIPDARILQDNCALAQRISGEIYSLLSLHAYFVYLYIMSSV